MHKIIAVKFCYKKLDTVSIKFSEDTFRLKTKCYTLRYRSDLVEYDRTVRFVLELGKKICSVDDPRSIKFSPKTELLPKFFLFRGCSMRHILPKFA